jgi:predicted nuclease of predicted toxin-antitoxin system
VNLLFEEILSPRMVFALAGLFPGTAHVDSLGLGGASDDEVWAYARQHGYTLVFSIP